MNSEIHRPKCSCGNPVKGNYRRADGSMVWRKICGYCARKITAKNAGISINELQRRTHPYMKYAAKSCSNRDGRLGFVCKFPTKYSFVDGKSVLHVDHIDGNPKNNHPDNLDTMCPTCHRVKTYLNKDHLTPGRKKKC